MRIIHGVIRPVMEYGMEVWGPPPGGSASHSNALAALLAGSVPMPLRRRGRAGSASLRLS